jgi:hypothetical protein
VTEIMAGSHFLNVDLNIESKSDLAVLKSELGRKVYVLPGGPVSPGCFLLRLETSCQHNNPDDAICAFCSMIEQLSPKGKRVWRSAHKKEFDIGHDVVKGQAASQFSLRNETLKRLSALGATLGITFYNHAASTKSIKRTGEKSHS